MTIPTMLRLGGWCAGGSAILLFAGQLYASLEYPTGDQTAEAMIAYHADHEGAIETGWLLLVPLGLLLMLLFVATLRAATAGVWSTFAGYCGVLFVSLYFAAAVLASTPASVFGLFEDARDPDAVGVFMTAAASFHLTSFAVSLLAVGLAAATVALAEIGLVGKRVRIGLFVLAAITVPTGLLGFGFIPLCLMLFLFTWLMVRGAFSARSPAARPAAAGA